MTNIERVYEIMKEIIEKKKIPLTSILSPKGRGGNKGKDINIIK
jgi:hypothetical protein